MGSQLIEKFNHAVRGIVGRQGETHLQTTIPHLQMTNYFASGM
jgi:hypothetical protein